MTDRRLVWGAALVCGFGGLLYVNRQTATDLAASGRLLESMREALSAAEATKREALLANQLLTEELSASLYTDSNTPLSYGGDPVPADGGGRPRLVLMSDTHGHHREIDEVPAGDILIHSGDYGNRGSLQETTDFFKWFNGLPHRHKIFVAGNHDQGPVSNLEVLVKELAPDVHMLTDTEVTVKAGTPPRSVRVYGSPWQPQFRNWPTYLPWSEIEAKWAKIPSGLDVLVTHTPPYKYGDGDRHTVDFGDWALLAAIKTKRPRLCVFGHIHNGSPRFGVVMGTERQTAFVNAAVTDNSAQLRKKPVEYLL